MRITNKLLFIWAAFFCLAMKATAQADTISYQYDDLGRLKQVQYSDDTIITYIYDNIGNRQAKVVDSSSNSAVALFSALPLTGETPLKVNFSDQSNGTVLFWAWDFDNSGSIDSTLQNPTHRYAVAGTYTVKLTVTGAGGSHSVTKVDYIRVETPVDIDGDGIPDSWEKQYFPEDLMALSANGDYDRDGYSDYQEYLNDYDPTVKDLPGGPGYRLPGLGVLPAVYMLLLEEEDESIPLQLSPEEGKDTDYGTVLFTAGNLDGGTNPSNSDDVSGEGTATTNLVEVPEDRNTAEDQRFGGNTP